MSENELNTPAPRRRPVIVASSLVVLVLAAGIWFMARGRAQKTEEAPAAAPTQATVMVTKVIAQDLDRKVQLPGELQAYQDVAIYPRVQGFVEWIGVDRGSVVKAGQPLLRMSAPELNAQRSEAGSKARAATSQRAEADARIGGIKAQRLEADAKLAADEATYAHLKGAAATPGVVAGNDIEQALRLVEADRARVKLYQENEKAAVAQAATFAENEKAAAEASLSVQDMESYLRITAPFDGVITERNVHKGSLAGPASVQPMLRIRQVAKLRLVVATPEADVAAIAKGDKLSFTVPAFPGETFVGQVERVAQALDVKTRSMPVELDVSNSAARLAPGMYAEVIWPVRRTQPSLFVPPSAIAVTTERTFVIRIRNEVAQWVDVKRGHSMGNLIEVFGALEANDQVAIRGTDELRDGARVTPKQAPAETR